MLTKTTPLAASLLLAVLLPLPALAATAAEHDHNHGQPPGAATGAPPAAAPTASAPAADKRVEDQMQRMRELHEKMMAAKTPAERQKLRAEGMKLMQDGMAMMKDMQGGGMGMGMMDKGGMAQDDQTGKMDMHKCMDMHGSMEKRMDMMETMMQTMLDQQATAPAKP